MWGNLGTTESGRTHYCHYCGRETAHASRIVVSDVPFCRKSCVERALGDPEPKDKTPSTATNKS